MTEEEIRNLKPGPDGDAMVATVLSLPPAAYTTDANAAVRALERVSVVKGRCCEIYDSAGFGAEPTWCCDVIDRGLTKEGVSADAWSGFVEWDGQTAAEEKDQETYAFPLVMCRAALLFVTRYPNAKLYKRIP